MVRRPPTSRWLEWAPEVQGVALADRATAEAGNLGVQLGRYSLGVRSARSEDDDLTQRRHWRFWGVRSRTTVEVVEAAMKAAGLGNPVACLLYPSDASDDLSSFVVQWLRNTVGDNT